MFCQRLEFIPSVTEENVRSPINVPHRLKIIIASVRLFPEFNAGEAADLNNNHSTSTWHCTGEPAPEVKTQLSTYIYRRRDTPSRTAMCTSWPGRKDGLKEA